MRRALYTFVLIIVSAAGITVAPQTAPKPRRAQAEKSHYACPMHPEVRSAKPGSCPKCDMTLRLWSGATPTEGTRGAAPGGAASPENSGANIPDVELLDQDGRKVRFYSDLVRGKVVAINFIFTTCTTVCPPLGATFARVQRELAERAGRDVRLISVSVDPVTDTPERLKAWGEKFKAGPGWTFVTGPKPHVDELLRALGPSADKREEHTASVVIGNDAARQWTKAYGLSAPSKLVKIINDAAEGRLAANAKESK